MTLRERKEKMVVLHLLMSMVKYLAVIYRLLWMM